MAKDKIDFSSDTATAVEAGPPPVKTEAAAPPAPAQGTPPAPRPAPSPGNSYYRVAIGESVSRIVEAPNEADAWAIFCDQNQKWPHPSCAGRVVQKLES